MMAIYESVVNVTPTTTVAGAERTTAGTAAGAATVAGGQRAGGASAAGGASLRVVDLYKEYPTPAEPLVVLRA
jgi:hypothetical protein